MIKDDEISISEDISANPNWTLNKKVIGRLNTVLSIYDLPQFTHKYFRWYLGDKEWKGLRRFKK
jgi:hypothetical protein